MPVLADFFMRGDSWLHKTDPRVKVLSVGLTLAAALILQNLLMMVILWLLVLAVPFAAGAPRGRIRFVLSALVPVSVLMPLVWIVFYPIGVETISFWFIEVKLLSLVQGLTVVLRIHIISFAVFALLFSTDQTTLVRGLVKLRLPYVWGLVLSLALRYIPTFERSFADILQAQKARGLEFESMRGWRRVRALMPVFVPTVISLFRLSEQIGIALEARGFGAEGVRRTYFRDITFRTLDWLYIAIVVTAVGSLFYFNLKYGFGADPLRLVR